VPLEANDPGAGNPPGANGEVPASGTGLKQQPGFVVSLCSIAAGLIGFGVPVIGMIASCAGIGLGIWGFRQGRSAHDAPGSICGIVGVAVSVLGIVFWVCAILFESYH
jgi:hypothetical protein